MNESFAIGLNSMNESIIQLIQKLDNTTLKSVFYTFGKEIDGVFVLNDLKLPYGEYHITNGHEIAVYRDLNLLFNKLNDLNFDIFEIECYLNVSEFRDDNYANTLRIIKKMSLTDIEKYADSYNVMAYLIYKDEKYSKVFPQLDIKKMSMRMLSNISDCKHFDIFLNKFDMVEYVELFKRNYYMDSGVSLSNLCYSDNQHVINMFIDLARLGIFYKEFMKYFKYKSLYINLFEFNVIKEHVKSEIESIIEDSQLDILEKFSGSEIISLYQNISSWKPSKCKFENIILELFLSNPCKFNKEDMDVIINIIANRKVDRFLYIEHIPLESYFKWQSQWEEDKAYLTKLKIAKMVKMNKGLVQ